ncbi:hypothetical protein LRS03_24110 [Rhizobacter sp. J219]|uniref:hypothetical protein n=1 Tax=Rhizobacter sp. J219 TaxID=2898430 RepID=UPI0021514408|nr:hypothetical protein [Rhizobacter sp. J219]MCR5885773.1 hypothetical protein [Rhizobacter sp. J219]
MTRLAALLSLALAAPAFAHDGHGAAGTHWHATDTWGFVVTLALVGAAVWFSRRK